MRIARKEADCLSFVGMRLRLHVRKRIRKQQKEKWNYALCEFEVLPIIKMRGVVITLPTTMFNAMFSFVQESTQVIGKAVVKPASERP